MQKRMGFVIFSICFLVLFNNLNLGHAEIKKDVDLISLHYDHAKDPDDCHSAAADRTIIQSEFGLDWMRKNVVAVSGACGVENCDRFVPGTDAVMDAVFNGVAGWVPAYTEDGYAQWDAAVDTLTDRWCETLQAGGDVWVKEGGQSDFTADVLAAVRSRLPNIDTSRKVHVVQHGSAANSEDTSLNEIWTDQSKLAFVKANTDYIGVRNGNEYLHWPYGEYGAEKAAFGAAALAHPVFGPSWEAAFALMSYTVRVDFSDTAMLMHILGLGEMNIANFKNRYLDDDTSYEAALGESSGANAATYKTVNGEVVIEAENYSRLAGSTGGEWNESKEKSGFTGSAYMSATSKDPGTLTYSSSTARMEYNIDFQETGTYYLHLRTYATSHDDNGFFATIDGRNFSYGHTQAYYVWVPWMNKWWWYADGGGAGARGYKISINITTTGVQKLAVVRRDKGTRVDRIWLTKKVSTSPKATNYTLPDPSKFLSSSSDTSGDSSDSSTTAGSGITFVQGTDANGLVQLDTFDYSAVVNRSDHNWVEVTNLGIDAMEVIPDSGANIDSNYVTQSPYLQFNVNFQKTGTHYVWLRGYCQGNDNTAHVGVNGNASATSANIKLPVNNEWAWSGTTMGGSRAAVSVSKTGLQTVEVYMREDGLILDKVLITSSAAYTPAGSGPAESVRK